MRAVTAGDRAGPEVSDGLALAGFAPESAGETVPRLEAGACWLLECDSLAARRLWFQTIAPMTIPTRQTATGMMSHIEGKPFLLSDLRLPDP